MVSLFHTVSLLFSLVIKINDNISESHVSNLMLLKMVNKSMLFNASELSINKYKTCREVKL